MVESEGLSSHSVLKSGFCPTEYSGESEDESNVDGGGSSLNLVIFVIVFAINSFTSSSSNWIVADVENGDDEDEQEFDDSGGDGFGTDEDSFDLSCSAATGEWKNFANKADLDRLGNEDDSAWLEEWADELPWDGKVDEVEDFCNSSGSLA